MKLHRLLFIALLISFFASCSKDDDDDKITPDPSTIENPKHVKFILK